MSSPQPQPRLSLNEGGVGREALDEPVAHGPGGLEADAAVPRAFAQDVSDGLDRAAALGSAEARDVSLEGDYEVLGVHAAPIVSVYGANDMAPWRHRYVNPGLAELMQMLSRAQGKMGGGVP